MDEEKRCRCCGEILIRSPACRGASWDKKLYCGQNCRMRFNRNHGVDKPTGPSLDKPGYGLDEELMDEPPQEILDEIEFRKSNIREGKIVIAST